MAQMIAERFTSVRKQVDGTKALLERLESPERVSRLLNHIIALSRNNAKSQDLDQNQDD